VPIRLREGFTREERSLVRATLYSYARGWFPMYDSDADIVHWVQPSLRGIIPLDPGQFRVSRSTRAVVRSGKFLITSDRAFGRVIRACAEVRGYGADTWINGEIIELFDLMHRAGHAHSVEAWLSGPEGLELVGGLYGLAVGSAFCGESMFSVPERGGTNASKVCLVHLVEHLRRQGFTVLDAQLNNPHLEQFGCYEITQAEYAQRMEGAAAEQPDWGCFDPLPVTRGVVIPG
jgi:leucyl/phenylalanyl-tRNA---protein transferase